MVTLPDIPGESAVARLFADERIAREATWFSLPGGAVLYEAGERADQLFVLRAGRLGVFRREEDQEPMFLGVIRPGEPVGEMALIVGRPHSAQVVALRDSEVFALPRDVFFAAADEDPTLMTELARLMIVRTQQSSGTGIVGEPAVFGFITLGEPVRLRPFVEQIGREIARLAYSVTVIGSEAARAPTEWFSAVEQRHDFVLYVGEAGDEEGWRAAVARQVDHLFQVGRGDRPPPRHGVAAQLAVPLQARQLMDLILIQPSRRKIPRRSDRWMDLAQPSRLFHLRPEEPEDVRRLARVITGQSVGLVLSGGGARAYAHVGAIRALREHGVPIDFIGGVSMGAIIGAGLAMGWSNAEMEFRIRESFVDSSPLDDIALPLLAMTHGLKVRERLAENFGDVHIPDLWLPYFCVSSNLTTGAYQLHRRGRLASALRASSALPGVLPPATDGDNVLVDGAVLKNFPADIMRAAHLGPVVGVDVSRGRSITADDVARPTSVLRWLLSGEWRKGPPIVSLLIRAATVSGGRDHLAAREASDVLVLPEVTGVEIRDWAAFQPAVEAGYRSMTEALDKLEAPVTELRRRASLNDPPLSVVPAQGGRRHALDVAPVAGQ